MNYVLGAKSESQLVKVDPRMVKVVRAAIRVSEQDFAVHDGARTAAEQNALYQQGRARPGIKVTSKDGYKNKSNHQIKENGFGGSVDLVPYVPGRGLVWDWDLIYPIAVAMSQASRSLRTLIRWGGNWYENMDEYPTSLEGIKAAVERYKVQHPGPDFIDGPHFELAE